MKYMCKIYTPSDWLLTLSHISNSFQQLYRWSRY